jgi:hypothetical protein
MLLAARKIFDWNVLRWLDQRQYFLRATKRSLCTFEPGYNDIVLCDTVWYQLITITLYSSVVITLVYN